MMFAAGTALSCFVWFVAKATSNADPDGMHEVTCIPELLSSIGITIDIMSFDTEVHSQLRLRLQNLPASASTLPSLAAGPSSLSSSHHPHHFRHHQSHHHYLCQHCSITYVCANSNDSQQRCSASTLARRFRR